MPFRKLLVILMLLISLEAFGQQDVVFHLNTELLTGKKVLKVKRDFKDPYLWVLAENNEVYRINSLTLVIDNYTPIFSAYHNLQFIDIAGRSQDTVFIATNSTNVIEYENVNKHLIGTADGIPGTVNSIGIASSSVTNLVLNNSIVMIATDKGFCQYDSNTDKIVNQIVDGPSKVYEATYRTEMFKDSTWQTSDFITQDTIQYQPSVYVLPGGPTVVEYLWEGGKQFGYNINTALVVYDSMLLYNEVFFNAFWGNSRGMFQNYCDDSFHSIYVPGGHYLDGINVNKITSIYGLTTLGGRYQYDNPGLIKQNLLVGTDNGLYFTSSIYTGAPKLLRTFSLFHDDELGTIRINDICVNALSTQDPICENGVWVAADNGLYYIKPDYGGFLSGQQASTIAFKNQPDTLTTLKLCSGDSAKAVVNIAGYPGNSTQWYKDGVEIPFQSKDTLTINTAGDYYAVLYDPCSGSHIASNHLQVDIITGPVFSFNYPDILQQCTGTPDTLKTENKPGYHYRWYTNSVLNGDTTFSFAVTQNGKYKLEVSACTNSWAPTKEVQVKLIQLPVPVIATDKASYCVGDNAKLSLTIPTDPSYTINWYRNNALLAGNNNQNSIVTNMPGDYTVSLTNNTVNTDGTTCSQTSAVQSLSFNPLPVVSIEQIVNSTLCKGQTIGLLAHYTAGTVRWSTGETTDQISVKAPGNYSVTVTSPAGCKADTSIAVSFFPNPILNLKDTTICTYKQQPITLTAPSGYAQYLWNNQPGNQTYQVSKPQKISLTVTDINGCQATQQIIVTDRCPNIWIPNTFTPNGDGVNDTWTIEGLDGDPQVLVQVFNRYGSKIYESRGYSTPWNGEYNHAKLPAGVYYYIVTINSPAQKFAGSLTILY